MTIPSPVCRYTRADIDEMAHRAMQARTRALIEKVYPPNPPNAARRRKSRPFAVRNPVKIAICAPKAHCRILAVAAAMFGVTVADLIGPRRYQLLVHARAYAALRLKNEHNLSYPQIGRLLGGRDHTTIINLIRPKCGRRG